MRKYQPRQKPFPYIPERIASNKLRRELKANHQTFNYVLNGLNGPRAVARRLRQAEARS